MSNRTIKYLFEKGYNIFKSGDEDVAKMSMPSFRKTMCVFGAIAFVATLFVGCNSADNYTPKPSTYYRISFPEKEYLKYDTACIPFVFEYPKYSEIKMKKNDGDVWFDVVVPSLNGVIFLSYKPLTSQNTLASEADIAHKTVSVHFNMASGVYEQSYTDNENKVYANSYTLKGKSIASTYQFWATDSVKHFVKGAFYINGNPNYDSLQPVYEFLHKDIMHLIETIRWKE